MFPWVRRAFLVKVLLNISERVCVHLYQRRPLVLLYLCDQPCCMNKPGLDLGSKLNLQDEWKKLIPFENQTNYVLKYFAHKHKSQNVIVAS